jgi:hypothetical protein
MAGVKLRHRLKGNAPNQVVNDCEIPLNRGILAGSFGSPARRGRLSRALTLSSTPNSLRRLLRRLRRRRFRAPVFAVIKTGA